MNKNVICYIVTLASMLMSCENDDVMSQEDLDRGAGIDTRASINVDNFKATWDAGDRVMVSDGLLSCVYKVERGGDVNCKFRISSAKNMFSDISNDETFYAFYPSSAVSAWNGSTVTAMIYTEQDYKENTEGAGQKFGGYYISNAAKSEDGNVNFSFRLAAGIVDINISKLKEEGITPTSVSIKTNSGVSIAGSFKYNCAVSSPAIKVMTNDNTGYSASTQSDVITVSDITAGADVVRFYVLPVTLTGGLTITVRDIDGKYYTKSSTATIGTDQDVNVGVEDVANATACRPYYKKINFGSSSNVTRYNNWMACVPGNIPFTMLSLSGTHDAATKTASETISGSTITQSLSLTEQLNAGVRGLDLRPKATSNNTTANDMYIYHGTANTKVLFSTAITNIVDFLTANPTETVFVLLHEEDGNNLASWRNSVLTVLNGAVSHIKKIDGNMKLSDCRGKMVIVSRDNVGDTDLCGKCGWGSSFGDKTVLYGSDGRSATPWTLLYQDEYGNSAYNNRLSNIKKLLFDYLVPNEKNANRVYVNTTNTEWTLFGTSIKTSARATNTAIVNDSELQNYAGRLGFMFSDYVGDASYSGDKLLKMIIDQNFKYVYTKRTRATLKASGEGLSEVVSDEYAKEDGVVYVNKRK